MKFVLASLFALLPVIVAQSVDSYISTEKPIAKANLLANIGATGSKSAGAKAGIVIASPQTDNPDYLFFWLRDGSLVRLQYLWHLCISLKM
jgi:glucoamylase